MLNDMLLDYMKKDNMIEGQQYYCNARNFTIGTWNGAAFEYVREKFGGTFTDTELHWDDGVPYGTAKPLSRYGVEDANS